MSNRAAASQRCFWSEVRQRSTLATRCATRLFRDSRQFVVFRLIPSWGNRPSRCRVSVSSRPFVETPDGRLVQQAEFRPAAAEPGLGLPVRGAFVGRLELPPPGILQPFRQIGDDVLPLVPLAPLDGSLGAEDARDDRPEALGPVEDDQEAASHAQAPGHELAEEGRADPLVLGGGLDKPEHDFLAGQRDAERDHHAVLGEGLPVEEQRDEVVGAQVPLLEGLELGRAGLDEAPRDTVEGLSPNAGGTASAAAA